VAFSFFSRGHKEQTASGTQRKVYLRGYTGMEPKDTSEKHHCPSVTSILLYSIRL